MANPSPIPTPKTDPAPHLQTAVYECPINRLVKIDQNARYMTADQQKRLTANVSRDGALTSVPLVYNRQRRPETPPLPSDAEDGGDLTIVSGNHRVESARAAGIKTLWVMEVVTYLTEQRLRALQLAHNAITGQDDLSQLWELYDKLDLDEKLYSGLTDDSFKLPEVNLTGLPGAAPTYQEIVLLFLPADALDFERVMTELGKRKQKATKHLAHLDDFDILFDAIVRTKDELKIYNSAVAIRAMADLAMERLDQIQQEVRAATDEAGATVPDAPQTSKAGPS